MNSIRRWHIGVVLLLLSLGEIAVVASGNAVVPGVLQVLLLVVGVYASYVFGRKAAVST